jgi:hypothetical protein
MTARQTAIAAGADLKWLVNSAALLRSPLRYTPQAAKWWGLVRLLTEKLGLSLKAAADAATAALGQTGSSSRVSAGSDSSGATAIVVDLRRYESTFLANLSRALQLETPRRRGRPARDRLRGRDAVRAASAYGVDVSLIEESLRRTPAERLALLEANAEFVRAARRVRR